MIMATQYEQLSDIDIKINSLPNKVSIISIKKICKMNLYIKYVQVVFIRQIIAIPNNYIHLYFSKLSFRCLLRRAHDDLETTKYSETSVSLFANLTWICH